MRTSSPRPPLLPDRRPPLGCPQATPAKPMPPLAQSSSIAWSSPSGSNRSVQGSQPAVAADADPESGVPDHAAREAKRAAPRPAQEPRDRPPSCGCPERAVRCARRVPPGQWQPLQVSKEARFDSQINAITSARGLANTLNNPLLHDYVGPSERGKEANLAKELVGQQHDATGSFGARSLLILKAEPDRKSLNFF